MRSILLALALTVCACSRPLPQPAQVPVLVEHQIDRVSSILEQAEPLVSACAKPALAGDKPCQVFVDAYVRTTNALVFAKRAVVLGQDASSALADLTRAGAELIEAFGKLGEDAPDGGV